MMDHANDFLEKTSIPGILIILHSDNTMSTLEVLNPEWKQQNLESLVHRWIYQASSYIHYSLRMSTYTLLKTLWQ